jgi:hypothetical protein
MIRALVIAGLVAGAVPASAQPMAGGGRPDPRQMSGQARPQEGDPAGRLTVRTAQGRFRTDDLGNEVLDFPKDAIVHLVAFDAAGNATVESRPVDDGGRAVFDGLATDGSRAYRAMAVLPRGATADRLISQPILMPPQVGLRLMLAGEAPDAALPAIDDQSRADEFGDGRAPPAGEVVVRLRGQVKGASPIRLVEVGGAEVGTAEAILQKLVVGTKVSVGQPAADPALRDGLVKVTVVRTGQPGHDHEHGAIGTVVEVREADGPADAAPVASVTTGGDGTASFEALPAGKRYVVRTIAHGTPGDGAAFDLPVKGGISVPVQIRFTEEQSLEARFEGVAGGPGKIYVASVQAGGRRYLSAPVMLTDTLGAATGIFIYPQLVMSFHGGSELDDQRMFFQLQISLINPTNSPRDPGPDGLKIPLPRGFRGASVDEALASRVKVLDDGVVWRGPLPPGQKDLVVGFSLDVSEGRLTFDLPLPLGAWQSQIVFEDLPGVTFEVPPSARRDKRRGQGGRNFVVLTDINIEPGKSMVLGLSGLPQPMLWQRWAPPLLGLVVLGLLGWAGLGIVRGTRAGPAGAEAERERLYGELVTLEQRFADKQLDAARFERERTALIARIAALSDPPRSDGPDAARAPGEL